MRCFTRNSRTFAISPLICLLAWMAVPSAQAGDDRVRKACSMMSADLKSSGEAKYEQRRSRTKFSVEAETDLPESGLSTATVMTVVVDGHEIGIMPLDFANPLGIVWDFNWDSGKGSPVADISGGGAIQVYADGVALMGCQLQDD